MREAEDRHDSIADELQLPPLQRKAANLEGAENVLNRIYLHSRNLKFFVGNKKGFPEFWRSCLRRKNFFRGGYYPPTAQFGAGQEFIRIYKPPAFTRSEYIDRVRDILAASWIELFLNDGN